MKGISWIKMVKLTILKWILQRRIHKNSDNQWYLFALYPMDFHITYKIKRFE